jgi:hypothetical protein
MNTTKKVISALAAVAACASLSAQTSPANPGEVSSSGLLGYKYVEAGAGFIDVNKSSVDGFTTGISVNLPAVANIDVAYGYSYSWVEGHTNLHANDIYMSGIYYYNAGPLKPFGALSLGYTWQRGDDYLNWGAAAGVEYQINPRISLTAAAEYGDDFKKGDRSGFDGTLTGHYWFTKQIAAFASVAWIEGGNFGYGAGVTFKY